MFSEQKYFILVIVVCLRHCAILLTSCSRPEHQLATPVRFAKQLPYDRHQNTQASEIVTFGTV